jgi:CubicO group peptidase (beta-lactamase class C family)
MREKRLSNALAFAIVLYTAQSAVMPRSALAQAQQPANWQDKEQGDRDLALRLARLDAMVQASLSQQNVPGYCLTVIKNGQVVFQKPYGQASLEKQTAVSPGTIFGLASITKTFTALTLLSLVDQGKVDLSAPLAQYVKGLPDEYKGLTIRQLASMSAGVPSNVPREIVWKEQIKALKEMPLVSEPGTNYLYSNYSYRLLGTVIANVTGKDYLQVVQETILAPLGMTSSGTAPALWGTGRVAAPYNDQMGRGPL